MNCYPSLWLDYYCELPVEEAIARLSAAGFTYGEISLTHVAQLKALGNPDGAGQLLRQACRDHGFSVPQGHLSFAGGLCDDSAMDRLKPELDLFAAGDIRKAVIHANGGDGLADEARYDRWVHHLRKLSDYVAGTGVTLCIENMPALPQCVTADQILRLIQDAGGNNLGICLDTGHLHLARGRNLTTETHRDFILQAGTYLQALHITDNSGHEDTHNMPFSARTGLDWKEVVSALREVNYTGLFNLEILGERNAPMVIKEAKLAFIRTMCDYMLSEDFLA